MFIFKKALTPFLVPPGIFIVLLLFLGIWLLLKRQWRLGSINCLIGLFMWLLSISPVADLLHKGLEADFKIPEHPHGDVIILLGGGAHDKSQDLSGTGAPSEETLARIITGVRLQKRLNIPLIVSGGKVYKHREADASIIKRFLLDLGVPEDKVLIEDKSRDTIENAKFTKEICERYNFKKPLLVSSASHMRRAILSFKKAGLEVTPMPVNFKTWEDKQYGWVDYLPHADQLKYSSRAIHEYIGALFLALRAI